MTPLRAYVPVDEQFEGKDLREEFLLYHRSTGRIHVLNGSARDIYLLCDGVRTVDDIARELSAQYEIDVETAVADVERTLARLLELGAVRPN